MNSFKISASDRGHAHTEAAMYAQGTPFSADDLFALWVAACESEGELVSSQGVYEEFLRNHPETTTPSEEMIRELCILTTRDDAGRHFTDWSNHYEHLESAGLIRIDRPTHSATGIPYGMDQWTLEVTGEGQAIVDANPELHPS